MKLWTSGEVWVDVADVHRLARNYIEQEVNKNLASKDYGSGVKEWAFISIILPPEIKDQYPERFKYHKSDKSVEFRLRIDLETFKSGNEADHQRLICQALLRSLDILDQKKVPDFDHRKLREDFLEIAKAHGWL